MQTRKKFFTARNVATLGILAALVILFQGVLGMVPLGSTTCGAFALVPIALGAILLGPIAGAFLGFLFGVMAICGGLFGGDMFTKTLLSLVPLQTVLICLVKGTLAGAACWLLYRLVAKCNAHVGVFAAAAIAPVVNTGIFLLGALLIKDAILAVMAENAVSFGAFVILILTANFLFEFIISLILSPAIYVIMQVVTKQMRRRS